ncbi:MAG: PepSY-like domain-containing protein [Candidatus Cryptobacteroides sp.]
MKRLFAILLTVTTLCAVVAKADNDKVIQFNQLPENARQFIQLHFPDGKVGVVKMENGLISKSYDVHFTDGNHIDFDGKGNWEEINCKASSVPDAIVPVAILEYVHANYPGEKVIKIEKDYRKYEVKLSSRIELTFDLSFNLREVDF